MKKSTFEEVKRNCEKAMASGNDYTKEITDLATAVAYSVINKCIDPQRKTAVQRDAVSNNGFNSAMTALKQGIAIDLATLDNTRRAANTATRNTLNADGDVIREIINADANNALTKLISTALTDGIDLVQTAIVAILEQAADHGGFENWLDTPYTVRRLSKKVYIQMKDSAAYKEVQTTPIQEIYRAVRSAVENSRAVQADARNGYSYIEELTDDGLDTIYHRLQKHSTLGGYNSDGNYTVDYQNALDYENIMERLNLTDRQMEVLRLRMQGLGYLAIGTYLGVTAKAIKKTVKLIQKKAIAIGLTVTMEK